MIDPAFTVHVLPADLTLGVDVDESIVRASERQGVKWPSRCGGDAECRACWLSVLEGEDVVAPPSEKERRAIEDLDRGVKRGPIRLACQLRASGVITVWKRGVRREGSGPAADLPPRA